MAWSDFGFDFVDAEEKLRCCSRETITKKGWNGKIFHLNRFAVLGVFPLLFSSSTTTPVVEEVMSRGECVCARESLVSRGHERNCPFSICKDSPLNRNAELCVVSLSISSAINRAHWCGKYSSKTGHPERYRKMLRLLGGSRVTNVKLCVNPFFFKRVACLCMYSRVFSPSVVLCARRFSRFCCRCFRNAIILLGVGLDLCSSSYAVLKRMIWHR